MTWFQLVFVAVLLLLYLGIAIACFYSAFKNWREEREERKLAPIREEQHRRELEERKQRKLQRDRERAAAAAAKQAAAQTTAPPPATPPSADQPAAPATPDQPGAPPHAEPLESEKVATGESAPGASESDHKSD